MTTTTIKCALCAAEIASSAELDGPCSKKAKDKHDSLPNGQAFGHTVSFADCFKLMKSDGSLPK